MELPPINKRIQKLVTFYAERCLADFAREIKIPEKSLNRLFVPNKKTGKFPIPSTKILVAIITAYPNVCANWLLRGTGEVFMRTLIAKGYNSCEKIFLPILNRKEECIKQQAFEIGCLIGKIKKMQKLRIEKLKDRRK